MRTGIAAGTIVLLAASSLHAQSRQAPARFADALKAVPTVAAPAPATKVTLTRLPSRTATPAAIPQGGRSFWKSPWPYVIAGAAVVIVVVAKNTEGGIY